MPRIFPSALLLLTLCALPVTRSAYGQDDPLTVEVGYMADFAMALRGGKTSRLAFLDNADVVVTADLDRLIGWRGISLVVYGLGNQGISASDLVGDAQGVDNIEAPVGWRIYEAFLEKRFSADRASLLAGIYDLNSEFDVEPVAGLFINSSFGIGAEYAASREYGPSIFPETSLGARLRVLPRDWMYVQAVVLDGRPGDPSDPAAHPFQFHENDGLLLAWETAFILDRKHGDAASRRSLRVSRTSSLPYRAKIGFGGWRYTARFDRIDGSQQRGNQGAYVMGQVRLLAEKSDVEQGLRDFARAGFADRRINRIATFTGFGAVYTGLLPGRPRDNLGLGIAIAHHGSPWLAAARSTGSPVERNEVVTEATYQAAITGWLSLQADLQWIRRPDMDPSRSDVLFGAVRIITTL